MFHHFFHNLPFILETYGYFAIFLIIAVESMGIPLPGETILVTAAIYAGVTGHLLIIGIIISAILGAILGDNLGYLLGRTGGFMLARRFGKYIKLSESKLKVGQYLFKNHGWQIVFFGRFIAFFRTWAAFLAGVNKMEWKSFLFYNTMGGILWATYYGSFAYLLGQQFNTLSHSYRILMFIIGTVFTIVPMIYISIHIKELEKKAKLAIPGDLR